MSSDDITFGPPGEEWHYSRKIRNWDLTHGKSKGLQISTISGPENTTITIAPELAALVIVDMQNYFLDKACRAHPNGLAAVEPLIKTIEKCREAGIQIIWLNWGLTDEDVAVMPASVQRGFSRDLIAWDGKSTAYPGLGVALPGDQGRTLMAGSWNAAIYPPLAAHVKPEDIHCAKNRMSGMWTESQPLWKHLKKEGKRTVLFTGVNTDQCVLGTLADAYNGGWECVLVEDGAATTTVGARDVCIYNIATSYGFVIDSKTLGAAKLT